MPDTKNKLDSGLTLIELLVVITIIGILTTVAAPYFISYRDKSRVAAAMQTAQTIRDAFASYAQSQVENLYPEGSEIFDWESLKIMCRNNGANLKNTETEQGIACISYTVADDRGEYELTLRVMGIDGSTIGSIIEIKTSGIVKYSLD